MADVQVTCITKPHPQSPHEHITHIGNPAANWKWTREQVIASIEAKTNTFYVLDPRTGKRADVGVVYPGGAGLRFCKRTQMETGTIISSPSISAPSGEPGRQNRGPITLILNVPGDPHVRLFAAPTLSFV